MGWTDWAKRAALGAATLGGSELFRGDVEKGLEDQRQKDRAFEDQSRQSARFAGRGERGYRQTGKSMDRLGHQLQRLANGQDSFSAEQLRQNLGQTQSAQQSMALGASPQNQAMAARTAANNMSRQQAGLAGQQALAGIAERQSAQQALGGLLGRQRDQDLQAALQGRQMAMGGYGQLAGEPGMSDRLWGLGGGALQAGGQAFAKSDKRAKTEIADGGKDADEFLKGLKAYSYKYKDSRDGEGDQLGVMAQDIEKTKFGKQIVRDTPQGKYLDSAKLSGANTAAIARLADRLSKLESK